MRKSVLLVLFFVLSGVLVFSISTVYGLSFTEQAKLYHDNSSWELGEKLKEGDFFHYRICDSMVSPGVEIGFFCYDLELEFIQILESWKGPTWIVQGNVTTGDDSHYNSKYMILYIDPETFEVNSNPLYYHTSDSIQNTIFYTSQYGKNQLSVGEVWGMIPSYFTNDSPVEITRVSNVKVEYSDSKVDTFVLGYNVIEESQIFINPDLPFPVKALVYDPNLIFPKVREMYYFELVEYYNVNYNVNYDISDYVEEKN